MNQMNINMVKRPLAGQIVDKEKLEALDFIRAVCALGIIIFHISCYTSADAVKILHTHANGSFGNVIVNIFLMISGGVLYYNYSEIPSLPRFYYKRWRSIFPMFYVAYLFYYMNIVLDTGTFFYGEKVWTLILTLFGLDGYFAYRLPTYYIVGEWFLGGLVLLYVLYPIFAKLVNRFGWKVLFILLPIWVWQLESDVFLIAESCNLIYIGGVFSLGMLIFKYELYRKKAVKDFGIIVTVVLLCFPCSIPNKYTIIVLSCAMFFALYGIGEIVMKMTKMKAAFAFFGEISFPFFLVQNKIGYSIVARYAPVSAVAVVKTIIVAVVMGIIYAWCVKAIATAIMQTNWFKKIDHAFLGDIAK